MSKVTLSHCGAVASAFASRKQWREAANCYLKYIADNPSEPDAYYNAGYYLKLAGQYNQSIKNYELALAYGVTQPEEVLTNMALIYSVYLRREDRAKSSLELALNGAPQYIPAMYNLATLLEEEGDRDGAIKYYQNIVDLEPSYYLALVRLAEAKRIEFNDPVIAKLIRALSNPVLDDFARSSIHYALGKSYNDCADYDQAFRHYDMANELDRRAVLPYGRVDQERLVDDCIRFFTEDWVSKNSLSSDAEPIFICGMFRSGSTLVEQILASHSKLSAGGERSFFHDFIDSSIRPYPDALNNFDQSAFNDLVNGYLEDLAKAFPNFSRVTDKRPDNYLYIGLIATIFPNAKIIQTKRDPRDNCLSVYFLRTSPLMNYAADLHDVAHYYKQFIRLMDHWKCVFPQMIYTIDYDQLVINPEVEVRSLLDFLNLSWEPECLNFTRVKNSVKTASVWQVRESLYKTSSGRWKNYSKHLGRFLLEFD